MTMILWKQPDGPPRRRCRSQSCRSSIFCLLGVLLCWFRVVLATERRHLQSDDIQQHQKLAASSTIIQSWWEIDAQRRQRRITQRQGPLDLNHLVEDASFGLPNQRMEQGGFVVDLHNIQCGSVTVSDVQLHTPDAIFSSSPKNAPTLPLTVDITEANMVCSSSYTYTGPFLGLPTGEGTLDMYTQDVDILSSFVLASSSSSTSSEEEEDSSLFPTFVESCDSTVTIGNVYVDAHGMEGISTVLTQLGQLTNDFISTEMGAMFCNLAKVVDFAAPYFEGGLRSPSSSDESTGANHEDTLDLPTGYTFLNLEERNTTTSSLFGFVLDILPDLGQPLNQSTDCFQANRIIGDYFISPENNALRVNLSSVVNNDSSTDAIETSTPIGNLSIQLHEAIVRGVDSFSTLQVKIAGKYTLDIIVGHEGATVELYMTVRLGPEKLDEEIKITVPIDKIQISTSVLMLLDEHKMGEIPIGALIHGHLEDALDCLLYPVYKTDILGLTIDALDLGAPRIEFLSHDELTNGTTALSQAIFSLGYPQIWPALLSFAQTTGVDLANDILHEFGQNRTCTGSRFLPPEDSILDMRDVFLFPEEAVEYGGTGQSHYFPFLPWAKTCLDEYLHGFDSTTGVSILNELLLSSQSPMVFEGEVFETEGRIKTKRLDVGYELKLWDARIENIDSLGQPVNVLDPVPFEANLLNNSAAIGVSNKPIRIHSTALFGIETGGILIQNKVNVSMEFSSVSFAAVLLARIAERKLLSLKVEELTDVNCILATLPAPELDPFGVRQPWSAPSASVTDILFQMGGFKLNVSCIECSSKELEEIDKIMENPEARFEAANFARDLVHYALAFVEGNSSFVQRMLDRQIAEASRKCHAQDDGVLAGLQYDNYDTGSDVDAISIVAGLLAIVSTFLGVALVFTVSVRWFSRRKQRHWLLGLPSSELVEIYKAQLMQRELDSRANQVSVSMFQSEQVPSLFRWSIPFIIVINMALFISGHLSQAGFLVIVIQFAGQRTSLKDFYSFSIVSLMKSLWRVEAYFLCVAVFLTSIIWPYIKQLLTMFGWLAPPRMLSVARRGALFTWIDFLAKWSIVDLCLAVLAMTAFQVRISTDPEAIFLPPSLYKIDIVVQLDWGLYANISAQIMSQVSSHFILLYHRRVERNAMQQSKVVESENGARATLSKELYRPTVNDSVKRDPNLSSSHDLTHNSTSGSPHSVIQNELLQEKPVQNMPLVGQWSKWKGKMLDEDSPLYETPAKEITSAIPSPHLRDGVIPAAMQLSDTDSSNANSSESLPDRLSYNDDTEIPTESNCLNDDIEAPTNGKDVNDTGVAKDIKRYNSNTILEDLDAGEIETNRQSHGQVIYTEAIDYSGDPIDSPTPLLDDGSVGFLLDNVGDKSDCERDSTTSAQSQPEALCNHCFKVGSTRLQVRRWVKIPFILLSLSTVVLVVLPFGFVDVLSTEILGLVSVVSDKQRDYGTTVSSHSIWSMAQGLVQNGRFLENPKNLIMQFLFAFLLVGSLLFAPIVLTMLLVVDWFTPLRDAARGKLKVAIEVFEAWQYIDPFILAVLIGTWQLGQLAKGMSEAFCEEEDRIGPAFSLLAIAGVVPLDDAFCLGMQSAILPGTYILVGALSALTLLRTFVSVASRQVRFEDSYRHGIAEANRRNLEAKDVSPENITPMPVMFTNRFRWLLKEA